MGGSGYLKPRWKGETAGQKNLTKERENRQNCQEPNQPNVAISENGKALEERILWGEKKKKRGGTPVRWKKHYKGGPQNKLEGGSHKIHVKGGSRVVGKGDGGGE